MDSPAKRVVRWAYFTFVGAAWVVFGAFVYRYQLAMGHGAPVATGELTEALTRQHHTVFISAGDMELITLLGVFAAAGMGAAIVGAVVLERGFKVPIFIRRVAKPEAPHDPRISQ